MNARKYGNILKLRDILDDILEESQAEKDCSETERLFCEKVANFRGEINPVIEELRAQSKNTAVCFLYRDASNYKKSPSRT